MVERPILMSASMVRAIQAGTKTQTRRVLKVQPPASTVQFCTYQHPDPRPHHWAMDGGSLLDFAVPCPYGQPGDRLWVRESHSVRVRPDEAHDGIPRVWYRADSAWANDDRVRWTPSIHMPRWASRILLEITRVRVERLHDIRRGDAMAEGCPFPNMAKGENPRDWYADLWQQINGPGSWDLNPWVWALDFKVLKQ